MTKKKIKCIKNFFSIYSTCTLTVLSMKNKIFEDCIYSVVFFIINNVFYSTFTYEVSHYTGKGSAYVRLTFGMVVMLTSTGGSVEFSVHL